MANTDKTYWDTIVIGSGMGGMPAAAALSRVGHKVLMLEQHQTLGGLTHSFSRDGFSWDVGIHYLSGVAPGDSSRDMLDSTRVMSADGDLPMTTESLRISAR